jgi:phosphoribosylformylglycinamidine synthase subunit PurSL
LRSRRWPTPVGAEIDLGAVPRSDGLDRDEAILFSESQSRFLVEVAPQHREAFEALIAGIPAARIGETNASDSLTALSVTGERVLDKSLADIREAHQATLRW